MATEGQRWREGTRAHSLGNGFALERSSSTSLSLSRSNSAVDMRQLTNALVDAREGTGEVRTILLRAAFKPRLPGLTKMVSKLSKEGAWRKALEVFETVEDMGLVADTALTNSAISACDKGGRWQKALEIFGSMAHQGLPRDAITYSATISSLAKGKQWHAALQVFDHMQSNHIEADVVTCCSLINALERGGQWQLAEKLFLQMCTTQENAEEEDRVPLGTPPLSPPLLPTGGKLFRAQTSPSSVLDGLQSPPGRPHLKSIAESPRHPEAAGGGWGSLAASIGILQSTANSRQDGGGVIVAGGTEAGMEELASTFNSSVALQSSCAASSLERSGSLEGSAASNPFATASRLMSGLRRSSLNSSRTSFPDQIPENGDALFQPALHKRPGAKRELGIPQLEAAASLRRAMSCCPALDGQGELGEGVDGSHGAGLASMFNFSHAARVTPNRVCCNALLAAYARAKPPQFLRALHLLTAMWDGGPTLAPDGVSYNTVIKACANAFQVGRAMDVYKEMVGRGVRPSMTTFNCLITAASDSASYSALLEVGGWLRHSDTDVRSNCMNAYVAGLVKVGHWEEAVVCFQEMVEPGSGVRPTASTFNTIMTGFMKAGQCDKVRGVFAEMLATGLSPSIVTYNTLLASYASLGAWHEALEAMMHVHAAQAEGVNPNMTTFNTCLAAIAKGTNAIPPHQYAIVASRALQVYHQMQTTAGCSPDAATHASLIRILDTTQQYPQVVAVHGVMLGSGHTPDAATAGLVLKAAVQMQGVQLDPEVLTHLLSSCVGAAAWELALQLCSGALLVQGPSVAPLFNYVLQQAASASHFKAVVDVLTAMRTAGLDVDPVVAAMFMGAQAEGGGGFPACEGAVGLPAPFSSPGSLNALSGSFSSLPGFSSTGNGSAGDPSSSPPPPPPPLLLPQPSPPPAGASWGTSEAPLEFTVQEANTLLESMKGGLDAQGGLEVLAGMKQAAIQPDQATYTHVIELMVRAKQPGLAVQLCSEAHEAGALQCYALPNLAGGAPQPGAALGNVLDLRRCGLELGVAVVLTWLIRCAQMCSGLGLVVRDPAVKLITGQLPRQAAASERQGAAGAPVGGDPCGAALRYELLRMLTTGACSLAAFDGLVPVRLAQDTVSCADDGTTILISTAALYKGLATA